MPAHSPARVLVVDDEAQILTLVSAILVRAGFEVETAQGGAQAWQLVERNGTDVDLLLTDIVMPDLSGTALAARCRARHPQLPILFMTGHRNLPDIPGPTVMKPFAASKLVESVRQALGPAA